MTSRPSDAPVLYIVTTGAPLTRRTPDGITAARDRGWWPAVISTASATPWLNRHQVEQLGVPLLSDQRSPDEPKRLPQPDAVALVPATLNTVNKLAAGIADTYAMGILCETLGARTPMVIVPFVNTKLAGHPSWLASLAVLRYAGATLIDPHNGAINSHEPLESGTGDTVTRDFQWRWVLDVLRRPSE